MTTLVALASKEALVMGTDSLGTVTKRLVDPRDLLEYFDEEDDFRMKLGEDGMPLLDSFFTVFEQAQSVPYNQLGNVKKLFDLSPLPMGVMFTGTTSIGDRTIGRLIAEFKEYNGLFRTTNDSSPRSNDSADAGHGESNRQDSDGVEQSNYKVQVVGDKLLRFLRGYYGSTYPEPLTQPELELIIGGYDRLSHLPSVFRIDIRENTITEIFPDEPPFGVAFGGQMDWIQRIVFGTDVANQVRLAQRADDLLFEYYERVRAAAAAVGTDFEVPPPDSWGGELGLFTDWDIRGLDTNFGDFSEQNAIDCVDFFIEIMIRAQGVSSQLPTVGGDVHIAVIRKDGFRFVSRQEWTHRDHSIQIPEVRR